MDARKRAAPPWEGEAAGKERAGSIVNSSTPSRGLQALPPTPYELQAAERRRRYERRFGSEEGIRRRLREGVALLRELSNGVRRRDEGGRWGDVISYYAGRRQFDPDKPITRGEAALLADVLLVVVENCEGIPGWIDEIVRGGL